MIHFLTNIPILLRIALSYPVQLPNIIDAQLSLCVHSVFSSNLSDQRARNLRPMILDYMGCLFEILKKFVEGTTSFNPLGPKDPNN